MITPITQKPRPLRLLVRQPDGSFAAQPYRKTDDTDRYVEFRKFDREKEAKWVARVEKEWRDKKTRAKAARKDAKKKGKLRAEQAQRNSDLAEQNAQIARQRLNMNKSADMIMIAKSVINGRDQGVDSRYFYREIQKRAAASRELGQTEAQAFAKYLETEPGRLLFQAMKKAEQRPWDEPLEDEREGIEDAEKVCAGDEAYSKLSTMARQLMAERERAGTPISFPGAFQEAYAKRPDLAQLSKQYHYAKIAKAGGYG